MPVAKIIEISAESPKGFEDAVREGIRRASKTVDNIKSAWVEDQGVQVEDAEVVNYRVHLKVTFILSEQQRGAGCRRPDRRSGHLAVGEALLPRA